MEGSRPADQRFRQGTSTMMQRFKYDEQLFSVSSAAEVEEISSTEEENSALATKVAQEEMDQIVSPTSPGTETVDKQSFLPRGKRKTLDALAAVFASDTASLNIKRPREFFRPSSNSSIRVGLKGTSHCRKGGSGDFVQTGVTRRTKHFSRSLQSSGPSCSVSPPSLTTEQNKAITGRNTLSVAHQATSAQGSGLANQSTVTTSSTKEEEDNSSLHSFGQTSKVGRKAGDTVNLMGTIQTLGFGSIGSRQTGTQDNHDKTAKHLHLKNISQRNRRNVGMRGRQPKAELLTPISNIFANLTAHDADVGRVSGSIVREVSYGERSGKTATTCVLNSGCSSVKAGRRESARRSTDYGCSIRQCDDFSELVHSSCSRELHSIVTGAGPGRSSYSNSISSGLGTPYQPYRPMPTSRMTRSDVSISERNSGTVDEILATKDISTFNKYKSRNSEVTPESSHAPSRAESSSASEQETGNSSSPTMECKFSGGDADPHVDGGRELAPTFVLSSGRMSKDEAKTLGLRPSTIDDDFDEYFAQLML